MRADKGNLLEYLAKAVLDGSAIPTIAELSKQMGVSPAAVREQLEVARRLGLVEVKPKVGIQPLDFSLTVPLVLALDYGLKVRPDYFDHYSDLRRHIESAYWYEAVPRLTPQDVKVLEALVVTAEHKISQTPIQRPDLDHRDFHLKIFSRLDNPVVSSVLEAYWDMYLNSGMTYYMDQAYLERVWSAHREIAEALAQRDFERGHQALVTHMDLMQYVRKAELKQKFE